LEPVDGERASSSIRELLADYQNTVVLGDRLDVVTTELVRLRCGRTHQCRICQTLRLDAARAEGVDNEMTAKIDRYETSDLSERHKLALRITDAMILRPDLLAGEVVEAALDEFGSQALVELCLDISKWSTQKIVVTLGLDGTERLPLNEQGITWFAFGDDGAVSGFWA
jgi:alkylhydroperoxidase family enzyme